MGIPVAELLSVPSGSALVFGSHPAQPQPEPEVLPNRTIGSSSGKWFEITRAQLQDDFKSCVCSWELKVGEAVCSLKSHVTARCVEWMTGVM